MSVPLFSAAETAQVPSKTAPTDFAKLFKAGNSISVLPTATAASGDAILPDNAMHLTVLNNSVNAAHFTQLPTPVIGKEVVIIQNGTASKLVTNDPTNVGISGGTGAAASVTLAANTIVFLICTSLTNWRGTVLSATIGTAPVQVAAAA
jgi:hypothetical protein